MKLYSKILIAAMLFATIACEDDDDFKNPTGDILV